MSNIADFILGFDETGWLLDQLSTLVAVVSTILFAILFVSYIMLSDEKLLGLYHKPDFPGSFSGVRVFKMFLKTDFNKDVSEKRIYSSTHSMWTILFHWNFFEQLWPHK